MRCDVCALSERPVTAGTGKSSANRGANAGSDSGVSLSADLDVWSVLA